VRNIFAGPIILECNSSLRAFARHKALLTIHCLFVYLFIYLLVGTHGVLKEKKTNCGGVSKDGKLGERNATFCEVGILFF
jgi:hypothetical protein